MLKLISDEFRLCMALAGIVKVEEISKDYLVKVGRHGKCTRILLTDSADGQERLCFPTIANRHRNPSSLHSRCNESSQPRFSAQALSLSAKGLTCDESVDDNGSSIALVWSLSQALVIGVSLYCQADPHALPHQADATEVHNLISLK